MADQWLSDEWLGAVGEWTGCRSFVPLWKSEGVYNGTSLFFIRARKHNAYSLQNQSVNVSEMNYCSEKQTKFSMHKLGGRNVELFDIQHAIHIVNNALERMVTILKNLKLKPSLRVYIL